MANGRFVSYLRVSTDRQGRSGLGLEAQRAAVTNYLNGGSWSLVAEVVEIESGGRNDRAKLAEALRLCRAHRATLVFAKFDRLSRDAAFLLGLQRDLQRMGLGFVAADMPEANELTIGIMAVVAQAERKMISERTKAALSAAKERGQKLGGARGRVGTAEDTAKARAARATRATERADDLAPILARIDPEGTASLRVLAAALTAEGIETPSGRGGWTPTAVARLRARLAA